MSHAIGPTKLTTIAISETTNQPAVNPTETIPKEFREESGIETPGRVKFARTEDGEIVVRPITSITDLRGVLAGATDEDGRTATERLREGRERDAAHEAALRDRDDRR